MRDFKPALKEIRKYYPEYFLINSVKYLGFFPYTDGGYTRIVQLTFDLDLINPDIETQINIELSKINSRYQMNCNPATEMSGISKIFIAGSEISVDFERQKYCGGMFMYMSDDDLSTPSYGIAYIVYHASLMALVTNAAESTDASTFNGISNAEIVIAQNPALRTNRYDDDRRLYLHEKEEFDEWISSLKKYKYINMCLRDIIKTRNMNSNNYIYRIMFDFNDIVKLAMKETGVRYRARFPSRKAISWWKKRVQPLLKRAGVGIEENVDYTNDQLQIATAFSMINEISV